jgi:hypothetical protein
MLQVRIGGYDEEAGYSEIHGDNTYTDFTYGVGIDLPLGILTRGAWPIIVSVDMTRMAQPTIGDIGIRLDDFSIYSLSVSWDLTE